MSQLQAVPAHPPRRLVPVNDTQLWVEVEGAGAPIVLLAKGQLSPKLQLDFRRACPQAWFVMLERSGSFSHVEAPETVLRLVVEFLADLEPANAGRPAPAGRRAP